MALLHDGDQVMLNIYQGMVSFRYEHYDSMDHCAKKY